jgi:hypothetical protein
MYHATGFCSRVGVFTAQYELAGRSVFTARYEQADMSVFTARYELDA